MFPWPCKAPAEVQEIKELAQAGRVGSSWPEVTRETPGEAEDRPLPSWASFLSLFQGYRPSLHVRRHPYLVHELGRKHKRRCKGKMLLQRHL